jgi:glycosidase
MLNLWYDNANDCIRRKNMINKYALRHKPISNMCFAYNEFEIEIRFKAKAGDLSKVELFFGDKYDLNSFKTIEMEKAFSDFEYDYYISRVIVDSNRLSYLFKLYNKKIVGYFTEWGYIEEMDMTDESVIHKYLMHYPYLNKVDVHEVPKWVKGAVFYQIFPERFNNGDDTISPEGKVKWDTLPTRENFFGGDLEGIYQKLDYLSDLGINAIYMTPIFKATTNHKYDTIDYFQIDPHFGDKETLKKLVKKAHSLNIKIVLDSVFNHSGYMFDKFMDVKENGEKSKYKDWFYIKSFPIDEVNLNYETFGFEPMMPKLNTSNEEVFNYLLDVAKYWITETDIDGWRLDVANEIDHEFWRKFRKAVKSVKSDAYIVGEVWHNSNSWLLGDQFDSIMNYPIQTACYEYFAKETIDMATFKLKVNRTYFDYSTQVNSVMMNLLDSHDTARFITESNGDENKLLMAFVFELFYLGCTSVYYGTEIGLVGENDPDCRKTMNWDSNTWNKDLFNSYKKLIAIANEYEVVKNGEFRWLNNKNLLSFKRFDDNEEICIYINNSERKVKISSKSTNDCVDLFNGGIIKKCSKIQLFPGEFKIFKTL